MECETGQPPDKLILPGAVGNVGGYALPAGGGYVVGLAAAALYDGGPIAAAGP